MKFTRFIEIKLSIDLHNWYLNFEVGVLILNIRQAGSELEQVEMLGNFVYLVFYITFFSIQSEINGCP